MGRKHMSREQVLSTLRERHREGLTLTQNADRQLFLAARAWFGTWYAALRAAGIEPPRSQWSKEKLVAEMQRLKEQGKSLKQKENRALASAARTHFSGWSNALLAAGIQPRRQRWTAESVIAEIRRRHSLKMSYGGDGDSKLRQAAKRYFGSLTNALSAADVDPPRRWTKRRVIRELKALKQEGVLAKASIGRHGLSNTPVWNAARKLFGSWIDALLAAGIEPAGLRTRKKRQRAYEWYESHPKGPKVAILQAIRERRDQGKSRRRVSGDDYALFAAALKYFGRWFDAVNEAGFGDLRPVKLSREDVLAEIRSRHVRGLSLTGTHNTLSDLHGAARRHFGNWTKALAAAGLPTQPRLDWTSRQVLDALRKQPDARLSTSVMLQEFPQLHRAARRYFGTWQNALRLAGRRARPPRRKWSRQKVIEELHKCPDASVRVSDKLLALAAHRLFGSLDNAREAAGIAPSPKGRTPEEIVALLQDRYTRGHTLQSSKCEPWLVASARSRFGTWAAALEAAGLGRLATRRGIQKKRPSKQVLHVT